jgi:hypothetical protein
MRRTLGRRSNVRAGERSSPLPLVGILRPQQSSLGVDPFVLAGKMSPDDCRLSGLDYVFGSSAITSRAKCALRPGWALASATWIAMRAGGSFGKYSIQTS